MVGRLITMGRWRAAWFVPVFFFFTFLGRGEDTLKISLEEVLSIGSLSDDTLFQWAGVAVDREGFIYVSDALDYSLKKFDTSGELVGKVGRKGEGPGEFTAPRQLDVSDDYVYVTDQYQPVIKVFDLDLHYRFTVRLRVPVGEMKALGHGKLAVVSVFPGENSSVSVYDHEGRKVGSVVYSEDSESFMMDMVSFEMDAGHNLYLAYNFADRIEKLDPQGTRLWSRKLLKIRKVKWKKFASEKVPIEIVYKDVALGPSGNLYVLGGVFSQHPSRDVYVLSPEGEYLAMFTLPHASHCLYIDREGFLYSRANEGVTLKKYRMNLEYGR